ncbi:MAG: hypothetical protein P1U65_07500 [Minwuia sp.]|nr:hypothetical protein [Minwuia sp.]
MIRGKDRHAIAGALFVLALGILVGFGFSGARKAKQQSQAAIELATPPVTVHETRSGPVTNRTVGIEFRATRHRNCRLSALAEWERPDGVRLSRMNPNKATLRPGQTRWIELEIEQPDNLRPGLYRVRSVGEYLCADGQVFVVPTGWIEVEIQ